MSVEVISGMLAPGKCNITFSTSCKENVRLHFPGTNLWYQPMEKYYIFMGVGISLGVPTEGPDPQNPCHLDVVLETSPPRRSCFTKLVKSQFQSLQLWSGEMV